MRVLGYILLGAVVLIVAACAIIGVFLYLAFVPTDPRYASPVSQQAAEGAVAFPVDFCASDRAHCEGYLQFARGSALLLVRGVDHVSAYETATGRRLWALPEQELRTASVPPDFIETHDGKYAFLPSGQVVDLDEGRIAFRGDTYIVRPEAEPHERVRRVRPGIYRFPYYSGVYLVDLEAGRILPYAHRDIGVSEAMADSVIAGNTPRYQGPVDQTDDGALAVWLTAENVARGPYFLSVHSREPAEELWRVRLPDLAGSESWIEGGAVRVAVGDRVQSYALRTGAWIGEEARVNQPSPSHWRSDLEGQCVTENCRPGEWTEVDSAASADLALVAFYETQAPEHGIRMHSGYFTGSGMEAGSRRLRVTRGVNGPTIFTRSMEEGRTTTRGYETAVAVSDDHAKVAVLATDGVVRIYALPAISGGNDE